MKTDRTGTFLPLSVVLDIPRKIIDRERTERMERRRELIQRQAKKLLQSMPYVKRKGKRET